MSLDFSRKNSYSWWWLDAQQGVYKLIVSYSHIKSQFRVNGLSRWTPFFLMRNTQGSPSRSIHRLHDISKTKSIESKSVQSFYQRSDRSFYLFTDFHRLFARNYVILSTASLFLKFLVWLFASNRLHVRMHLFHISSSVTLCDPIICCSY